MCWYQWYSGSAPDYWPTDQAFDPAPGAWFTTKFISFALVVHGPVLPNNDESWPKTTIISFIHICFNTDKHKGNNKC